MNNIDNKKDLLYKLYQLQDQGIKLSNYFDINSDLIEMQYEYELHKRKIEQDKFDQDIILITLLIAVGGATIYSFMKKKENYKNKPASNESFNILNEFIDGKISVYELCNYLGITYKTTNVERDECILCYSSDENQIITKCGHNYCVSCLMILINQDKLKDSCVYCKKKICLNECIIYINDCNDLDELD